MSPDLALIDQMPLGLGVFDINGALVHANPHYERLVAVSCLPSQADQDWRGIGAEDRALAPAEFPCARALRGDTVCPGIDLTHVSQGRPDGCRLKVSAAPIVDPETGVIVGVVLLFIDLQQEGRGDLFGARAARRFRQFAEQTATPIWIADAYTEELIYRNPAHLELCSATPDPCLTLTDWLAQLGAVDRLRLRGHYAQALVGQTAHVEYRLCGAGGWAPRTLRETVFPIRNDAGEIGTLAGMMESVAAVAEGIFYLVGNDSATTRQLAHVLECGGQRFKRFEQLGLLLGLAPFLAPGCVVVDLAATPDAETNLPGLLANHAATLPIIVIGAPDTRPASAVAAMRSGAADYLVQPVTEDEMKTALTRAVARLSPAEGTKRAVPDAQDRLAHLSKREREVLGGLSRGGTNKSIARDLGISPRTVELHRAHLMERMNARSLAELLDLSRSGDAGS